MTRRGLVEHREELVRQYRDAGYWNDQSLASWLGEVADAHSDRVAVVTTERRATYGQLAVRTNQIAFGLYNLGLRPGDAVTLQMANTLETVEVWYALLRAGIQPVCTLSRHRHHEIDEIARITGARAHIVQADLPGFDAVAFGLEVADHVESVRHVLTTRSSAATHGTTRVEDLDGLRPDDARRYVDQVQAALAAEDVAVLQLSGGTTATPKVIPRRHAEYAYNVRARIDRWEVTADDCFGYVLPLVHNAGIQTSLHVAHALGASLVLADTDPDQFLPLFVREGVTRTLLPTGFAASLVDHPAFDDAISGMDVVALTLGRVPPWLFDRVSSLGPTVIQEFGMGEGLIMTHSPRDPESARRETVGYPISPADEVRLIDPDTRDEVADGAPGVLQARGPYTIPGYLDAPERNAQAFTADGYYETGDVMSSKTFEGRRYYVVEGRTKDLINRGGEKINTEEIEGILLEHPAISEVALVAVPDDRLGERACAVLVVTDAAINLDDIRRFLDHRGVARFKWPERIEIREALPRTSVGKVAKNRLRDDLAVKLEPSTTGGS